jgi:hypothetical protein
MSEKKSLQDVSHFDQEGTLTPPGPIGRFVRLALGLVIVKFVYDWFTIIDVSDIDNPFVLIWVAFSIALAPYVVNIGFGVNFGAKPRYALIMLWAVAAFAGYLLENILRSQIMWSVVEVTKISPRNLLPVVGHSCDPGVRNASHSSPAGKDVRFRKQRALLPWIH